MAISFDQEFIDTMTPHHESAIEMAKLALERAEHPELKELAGQIVTTQSSEIARMQQWRRDWFGGDSSPATHSPHEMAGMEMGPSMTSGTMDMKEMVDGLRTAQPFDKAFLEEMVPHHGSAIEMAEEAQERAEHPEIRQLADEITTAQKREIATMEGWLRDWY
jgi:uncharacterized protein (DUF305 family)